MRRVVRKPSANATEAIERVSERAIRSEAAGLVTAYNAKNAEALAGRFLSKAEYEVDTGEVLAGRQAIQDHFARSFETNPQLKARLNDTKVRLVSSHMATQEGTFTVTANPEDGEAQTPFVAIWTTDEGQWRLASIRELAPDDRSDEATPADRLQPLAWLVGDWVDESHESVVKISCRWSDDGNFLLQDFTVKSAGEEILSGTQRLGWDPLTHKIHGWLFDSTGGHGESTWNWDGNQWVVRASSVRRNGQIDASLNTIVQQGPDTYRWESSHRMLGDDPLPNVSVVVVRQAPTPPATAEPKKPESSRTNQ